MFETRLEAAGLVAQVESRRLMQRLQLKLLAALALFIAAWAGVVLLAIVLPPHLRVPVLSAVVGGLVLVAILAWRLDGRKKAAREVGSIAWFLESLKLDIEIFSRTLAGVRPDLSGGSPPPDPSSQDPTSQDPTSPDPASPDPSSNPPQRSPSGDIAA